MIYAVIALAVICVTLIALIASLNRSNTQERADRAAAYERTLQTLADRIQAPERLPVRDIPEITIPEHEPDEYAQVGASLTTTA
jgi:hypothetical protein